jgi:hypothetical protein
MGLKRFSDFSDVVIENNDSIISEDIGNIKKIELDKKTGKQPEKDTTIKNIKNSDNKEEEKETPEDNVKETVDNNFQIIILEDNIIKFENVHIKKIYELLSEKYSTTDYFIRSKDNNLHIVKYNDKLNLDINGFVDSLFKFYSTKEELRTLSNNIKIKGNDKFSVVENVNPIDVDKIVGDLSRLLSTKK